MQVKLISITSSLVQNDSKNLSPEELITYCARVSNPSNQLNLETAPKLLAYCIKNGHWSIFQMADFCVEIVTSRAIAQQILRHTSFSFQEFSQRYAQATDFEPVELRFQGKTNRQVGDTVYQNNELDNKILDHIIRCNNLYLELLNKGIAKESARFILPLTTQTKIFMKGNIRSWIHYIQLRSTEHTQKEHRLIALEIKKIFIENFPNISIALGWKNNE